MRKNPSFLEKKLQELIISWLANSILEERRWIPAFDGTTYKETEKIQP
jgi:hypothetical protein